MLLRCIYVKNFTLAKVRNSLSFVRCYSEQTVRQKVLVFWESSTLKGLSKKLSPHNAHTATSLNIASYVWMKPKQDCRLWNSSPAKTRRMLMHFLESAKSRKENFWNTNYFPCPYLVPFTLFLVPWTSFSHPVRKDSPFLSEKRHNKGTGFGWAAPLMNASIEC